MLLCEICETYNHSCCWNMYLSSLSDLLNGAYERVYNSHWLLYPVFPDFQTVTRTIFGYTNSLFSMDRYATEKVLCLNIGKGSGYENLSHLPLVFFIISIQKLNSSFLLVTFLWAEPWFLNWEASLETQP